MHNFKGHVSSFRVHAGPAEQRLRVQHDDKAHHGGEGGRPQALAYQLARVGRAAAQGEPMRFVIHNTPVDLGAATLGSENLTPNEAGVLEELFKRQVD